VRTETRFAVTWELSSLLPHPTSAEFRAILDQFRGDLNRIAERSDALPPVSGDQKTSATWAGFLRDNEQIVGLATDLHAFIECYCAAEAENKEFQQLDAHLSSLDPLRERIASNIELALQNASESDLEAMLHADSYLGEIAYYLRECRRIAQLRLPRDQEVLAAELAVDGIHAWGRLYDRISGELKISVMERGAIVEKSPGQVQLDSPQRTVRENNFFAANKAWSRIADTCADAINHIAGTRLTRYRRLKMTDHLVAPLCHNRMRRETLDTMWKTITARKGMLVKFLNKKAEMLGLERLAWYDLQAPPATAGTATTDRLSYDEACELTISTFASFSPELGEFARQALEQRWVEVENRSGKRQGGFCTGFPTRKESRIFMTFTNTPDSMSTLAHELGHAYHSHVLRDRSLFLQDYPMNLAETASTFAEAVLIEHRLKSAGSEPEQLAILDNMLSDAVVYLMNIHARFLFENQFHLERAAGELPAARISELMLAAQKEAYCDALAPDGWNPNFWVSKLHFYISTLPFYNFPYTFGYLLSLGVYSLAQTRGAEFPEQYRRFLVATGCQDAEDAVRSSFGEDLSEPAFWNRSLDIVENRVRRFLELAAR
jgi:pepF/M3 family oligoendopeptidase